MSGQSSENHTPGEKTASGFAMLELPRAMRTRLFWCITLVLLCHPRLWAQTVTSQFPPAAPATTQPLTGDLPDDPSLQSTLPEAHVVPQPEKGLPVRIEASDQRRDETKDGVVFTLDGDVVIYYRAYIVHADHAVFNQDSGEVVAHGHMMVDGGPDDEHFVASHGTINVQQDTGDFFDVVGTLGVSRAPRGRMVFTAPNPFALSGREVLQLGKGHYRVIHGSMTSCMLPKPDWRIVSGIMELNNGVAKANNSYFEGFRVPLFYLPYITHAVSEQRSSGVMLPYFGNNTTKGFVVGEGWYQTLGRSADLTMATQWWSKRGWAPNGMFRYRGLGEDFAKVQFHSLLDEGVELPNGARGANQGGVDITAEGRHDFDANTSGVIDAEYLSSYVYRLVFEEDYAIAIDSEVKSQAFVTHEYHDMWLSLHMNRYQNFESSTIPSDEVRILHLPQIDVEAADHPLGDSALMWGLSATAGAISRYDYPSFRTSASVPRVDFYPRISMPLHFDGWTFRPEAAVRETWYGKSQATESLNQIPVVSGESAARTDVEAGFDLRPPALERDFSAPWLERLLGGDVRHTIEPDLQYRYVTGINDFQNILRFDDTDIVSNTNEAEYGLTQRLFLRNMKPHPCSGDEALQPENSDPTNATTHGAALPSTQNGDQAAGANPPVCGGGTRDWITWRVAQKYYFEPDFDHAVTPGTPNPLATTLDFTGVDFLTTPRHNSPVISRLRMQTTSATDLEWDLDYDVKEGKITSSNVYAGYQAGLYHFQFGDSYMNVPLGVTPLSTAPAVPATPDVSTPYNQIHLLAVRGAANKLGFSEGVSTAYDLIHQQLQFGAIQAQYNWNCCGIDFQYRRFSLGAIRDDTEYFWSINLAGFTNAGDLTHRISLF
jgi:LPS-assembly protein